MDWQYIWNHYIDLAPGIAHIALRLACAMLIGIVIGLEREFTHRPAGLRTHILVVLGACVVSITGEMLFSHYSVLGSSADPARLSAQVITGVGFLGAGTIMKEGANVRGLTTAASVWAVACLGIACGFGYYIPALLGTVLIMFTLTIVEALQHKLIREHNKDVRYELETSNVSTSLTLLYDQAQLNAAKFDDLSARQTENGHVISFDIHFSGRRSLEHQQRFFEVMASAPDTLHFRRVDTKINTTV